MSHKKVAMRTQETKMKTIEEIKTIVGGKKFGQDEASEIEIVARYEDGAVLVRYIQQWRGLPARPAEGCPASAERIFRPALPGRRCRQEPRSRPGYHPCRIGPPAEQPELLILATEVRGGRIICLACGRNLAG